MKLLFDQNLSPSLPRRLEREFPGSLHVRDVGLAGADDATIWNYALTLGLTVVSKDSDFQQRSLLLGAPPKFCLAADRQLLSGRQRETAARPCR